MATVPVISQIANAVGGNLAQGIADIIRLFKVDPNLALQNQVEVMKIQADLQGKILDTVQAQSEVNKAEAASQSLFVSGWRPAVGWCCGAAFAYAFIIQPLIQTCLVVFHSTFDPSRLPVINFAEMSPVLLGMLGLAAARSYDKTTGTSNGH